MKNYEINLPIYVGLVPQYSITQSVIDDWVQNIVSKLEPRTLRVITTIKKTVFHTVQRFFIECPPGTGIEENLYVKMTYHNGVLETLVVAQSKGSRPISVSSMETFEL